MSHSVEGRPRGIAGTGEPRTDFVNSLRELCIVFRAESGIPCRTFLDVGSVHCGTAVGDALNRSLSVLLGHASKRGRATAVTVTAGTEPDGAVLIRLDIEEPAVTPAAAMSSAVCARVRDLQARLLALGVCLEVDATLRNARFAIPRALIAAG